MWEGEALQLRFRHMALSCDVGPLAFNDDTTIAAVKEALFTAWPTEGVLSKDPPSSSADIRILCSGQYLDNVKTLRDYRKLMVSSEGLEVITLHLFVRPPHAGKAADKGDADALKQPKSGCACVIC